MTGPAASRRLVRRGVQLVMSSATLGVGVSLLLGADLGADGFAMLIDGVSEAASIEFAVANMAISVVFVAFAWWRGRRPGVGTVVFPAIVGIVVSLLDGVTPTPDDVALQAIELLVAFVLICLGVAGYLGADLGAGPTEAAALVVDPPIPFRWAYNAVQLISGVVGWALGATFGVGSLIVVALIGPCVDRLLPIFEIEYPPAAPTCAATGASADA